MTEKHQPPISVRDLMAREESGTARAGDATPGASRDAESTPPDATGAPPVREIEIAGVTWRVSAVGRARSGWRSDAGAPLLFVRFTRVGDEEPGHEPGESGGGRRESEGERDGITVAPSLDALSDEALVELLERVETRRGRTR